MQVAATPVQLQQRHSAPSVRYVCLHLLFVTSVALATLAHGAEYGTVRGGRLLLPSDEISPAERGRIKATLSRNIDALQRSGRITPQPKVMSKAAPTVLFQWPLQLVPGHPEHVPRTGIASVDHDSN